MNKKIIFFSFCLFSAYFSNGQNDQSVKITVFKPAETTTEAPRILEDRNCIKWNYSLLGRGVFLLNYEFPVSKYISTELGLGVTYRDFIFEMYSGIPINDFTAGNKNFGYAVEGGIRLYPKEFDNFEGFFISPVASFRKYNTSPPSTSSNSSSATTAVPNSSFKPGYNLLDLQFKIGFAYESLWDWDLIGEIYTGFAMRYATARYYTYDSSTGASAYIPTTERLQLPQFLLGLKMGVPF